MGVGKITVVFDGKATAGEAMAVKSLLETFCKNVSFDPLNLTITCKSTVDEDIESAIEQVDSLIKSGKTPNVLDLKWFV